MDSKWAHLVLICLTNVVSRGYDKRLTGARVGFGNHGRSPSPIEF